MKMSNKVYDILKWIAQYFLPAVGALYFALAGVWGFPHGEEVVGTIAAIDTFLGVVLGISSAQYNKANRVDSDANKSDNNANNN
jgi:hypothetical protein